MNFLLIKVLFFLLLTVSNVFSNEKIVYIDMNILVNNSKAGTSINTQMEKLIKKNNLEYEKIEKNLLKEEKELIKKKNLLDTQKYNEEVNAFKKKIDQFKIERKKKIQIIKKQNVSAKNELVNYITNILAKYSKDNELDLVLNKEGIILGKKTIDITNKILELLNKEVQSIKF